MNPTLFYYSMSASLTLTLNVAMWFDSFFVFDFWDTKKYDISKGLINTCIFGLFLFERCHYHCKKPCLESLTIKNHRESRSIWLAIPVVLSSQVTTSWMQLHREPGEISEHLNQTNKVARKKIHNHYFRSLRF